MFSTWRALLLPLALVGLIISGTAILGSSSRNAHGSFTPGHWRRALDGIVLPATARAIEEDAVLRRNYAAVVEITAGAAEWLAERYKSESLRGASRSLDLHYEQIAPITSRGGTGHPNAAPNARRSLVDSLGNLINGMAADAAANNTNLLSSVGGALSSSISDIGNSLLQDLSGTSMFLGIGIGQGAASGLNITTPANAMAVASKVVAASGMNNTGINPAVQSLGMGVTSTLVGSVNTTALFPNASSLGLTVLGLATGIGNGAASGLKVNSVTPPNPSGASVPDIANTFGFGMSNTFTSNVNTTALFSATDSALRTQVGPAAFGLAQGLGNGLVSGLKLNTAVSPPSGTAVPDIAGNFGFGLSQSLASNVNVTSLASNLDSTLGSTPMLLAMLPAAASGFGKGLGEGIPIGLGIQPDPGMIPLQTLPDGSLDASGIAQNFAIGFTSKLLANNTLSKLAVGVPNADGTTSSVAGGALGSLDIGKAAGGFARGLIQGAGDSITAMGGINAVIAGTAVTPSATFPETPINFNDSLNGAAVGFGQGLGSQGVMVVNTIVNSMKVTTPTKRDAKELEILGTSIPRSIEVRQTDTASATSFNISTFLTPQSLSLFFQKAVDLLTPEGIGGVALVGLGLLKSGTIPADTNSTSVLSQLTAVIPPGTAHFTVKGFNYDINLQQVVNNLNGSLNDIASGMQVNGTNAQTFTAFLIVHIFFAIFATMVIVPVALGLESARNILMRISKPHHLVWERKWTNMMWFLVIGPSMVLILIFGVLAMGNAAHFRTAHGILGLVTIIDATAALGLHFAVKIYGPPASEPPTLAQQVRSYNNQVLLALVSATTLTGFTDLNLVAVGLFQVVPFDASISIGFGLAAVYTIGSTISQFDMFLDFKEMRQRKKAATSGTSEDEEALNQSDVKEKAAVVTSERKLYRSSRWPLRW